MKLQTIDKIEIITLVDNRIDIVASAQDRNGIIQRVRSMKGSVINKSVLAEHGFSCLINLKTSKETNRLLFDFGSTDFVAAYNAELLEINLSDVDKMILSHGHFDHYGGMKSLVQKINHQGIELLLHPAAFRNGRYSKNGKEIIKASPLLRKDLEAYYVCVTESVGPKMLFNDTLLFLGEIPRIIEFEKGNPGFFYQEGDKEKEDKIEDDTAVVTHVNGKGLVILTGCAHSGIINIVTYAMKVTGVNQLFAVFGGFHLSGNDYEERIEPTIKAFKDLNPKYIVPTHCTGHKAFLMMEQEMPEKVLLNMSGRKFSFRSPE